MTEPTKLHGRHTRHIEDLKKQIAHCLDRELDLLAEERSERARRLGIDHKPAARKREVSA
jgi:hypothetical protein